MAEFLSIAFFTFLSEDLACITAGSLAARSDIQLWVAIVASYVGIVVGDLLLYLAGYSGGALLLKTRWGSRFLAGERVIRAQQWLKNSGGKVVILSRFVPGTRLPTYVAAGILRMPVTRFTVLLLIAALFWTPILVVASYLSGTLLLDAFSGASAITRGVALAGIVAVVWLASRLVLSFATWRGRRLLYSRIERLLRWEFWPMYYLYVPVGFYLLYLAIRHRQLAAFTACNPAIYASGMRGESKSQILAGLKPSAGNFGSVAPFILIRAELPYSERKKLALAFLRKLPQKYPVVIKPDVGERGSDVKIVRSQDELEAHLRTSEQDVILQQYIQGHEYGVFYYRYPSASMGRIFAITDKRLITLTGDGLHTLEELILRDKRAVLMAKFHLEQHRNELDYVVPKGAAYPLVQLGTHCKGVLFLDGSHLITPELTRAIDRISQNYVGFFFGRYDIRVPSEKDLRAGKNLRVLELNGVTSEATSMYDPRHSLWHAYKILFAQWRIAVEIGLENIRRGAKPVGLKTLLQMAFRGT